MNLPTGDSLGNVTMRKKKLKSYVEIGICNRNVTRMVYNGIITYSVDKY